MFRKIILLGTVFLTIAPALAQAADMTVFKSASCGCCGGWIKHMEDNGFRVVARNAPPAVLTQRKLAAGLKPDLTSCHTGEVAGYIVEGHVPAADVRRLLMERPTAIGLAVPDMPLGSPGMESDSIKEPYNVLLVKKDGTTEVFSSYL
jgi:hypothetical protein